MPGPAATPAARYLATGVWKDTAGTVAAVAEGDLIARVDDQSGNGRHLLQPDPTKRPVLRLNRINGRPTVQADGVSQFLTAAFSLPQPWAAYAACTPNDVGYARSVWDGGGLDKGWLATVNPASGYAGTPGYLAQYVGGYGRSVLLYDGALVSPNGIAPPPCVVSALYNGSSSWLRLNAFTRTPTSIGAADATGFTLASEGNSGASFGANEYAEVIVYGRSLSDADDLATLAYLQATYNTFPAGLPLNAAPVICDGDSLTWASFASSPGRYPGTTSWPSVLQSLLGTAFVVANLGVPGTTATAMAAHAAYRVDPSFNAAAPSNLAIFWEAVNEWSGGSGSPSDAYAQLATWVAGRKAAGFKTAVLTATPSSNMVVNGAHAPAVPAPGFWDGHTSSLFQPQYNALVLANSAGADYLIDVASDPRLSDPANSTYFHDDNLHLTDAGYAAVAGLVKAALAPTPGVLFLRSGAGVLALRSPSP